MSKFRKKSKRRAKSDVNTRSGGGCGLYVFCGGFIFLGSTALIFCGIMPLLSGKELSESMLVGLFIGSLFTFFGISFFILAKKDIRARANRSPIPEWDANEAPDGIQDMKPQMGGTKGSFFLTGAFALFWNAVIGLLIFSEQQVDGIVWFFVGVGALLIIMTISQGLALFNPKVKLILHNVPITLGKEFAVHWTIDGNIDRLDSLKITLIGQEKATYQRGTDSYTDTHDFYTLVKSIALDKSHRGHGQFHFAIPENAMHTWQSSNNKVVWLLRVEGDIPKWPDIYESYEVTVFPIHSV